MEITSKQIAAARTLLGWSQQDLEAKSDVSIDTIRNIESRGSRPRPATLERLVDAFMQHGIEFIAGGVRERHDLIETLEGERGIEKFYNRLGAFAEREGSEILIYAVDQENLIENIQSHNAFQSYQKRISQLGHKVIRVLKNKEYITEENATYAESRYLDTKMPQSKLFYFLYGKNLALLTSEAGIKIILIRHDPLVELFKQQFELYWLEAKSHA